MLTVEEAEKIIAENLIELNTESLPTLQAWGRVLAEEVRADRDFPPFDRATMDGIAILHSSWAAGQRKFEIQGTQFAGMPPFKLTNPQNAIEIMTGAVCPQGADTIIRFEDLEFVQEGNTRWANVKLNDLEPRQNLHLQGIDKPKGDLMMPVGTLLGSPEIAVAASVGKTHLIVSQPPKIAIISNGDELVGIEETPLPYQVRRSNVFALATALAQNRFSAELFHLPDDRPFMEREIQKILTEFDILILSGGVSQGYADYIPLILNDLGVQKLFHQVKQRPGKPFWFGRKDQKIVFALPGNPVSTIMCFYRYTLPYLYQISQYPHSQAQFAQLAQDFTFKPDLSYFLGVKTQINAQGILQALPEAGHGSGDFANLLTCDGFLELPANQTYFRAGEVFKFWGFRTRN
ncbi:MAG: molybdopterin molybdotransferase MoeA [Microscillaceae bacterium]|jgi:molybdopterin molybdotransferase|nr:molybdopterin molybdotransferase MoeA [Microscillaceae bacterium]